MLKPFALLTCFAMALGSWSQIQAQDLFSDVEVGTVFSSLSSGTTSKPSTPTSRITRVEQLRDLLKEGGFAPSIVNRRTISMKKELDPWSFPVLIEISEDETQLTLVLGLSTIQDISKDLTAENLLKLMSASQHNAPALFTYTPDRKRTELLMNIPNAGLTPQSLRDQINRLAVLAKGTEAIWYRAELETESNTVDNSLLGKWSASRSESEAVAIEFKSDRAFNMVFVTSGSPSKSSGTFSLENGTLTLSGSDGTQLAGKITLISAVEFRLELLPGKQLTFKKAS